MDPRRFDDRYDPDQYPDDRERYDPSDEHEPPDDDEPEDNVPDAVADRLAWDYDFIVENTLGTTIAFDTDPLLISTEVVGEVYTRFPRGQWPAAGLTVMIPSSTSKLHQLAIKGIFKDDPITLVLYDETFVPYRGRNIVYMFETGTTPRLVPWIGA